MGKLIAKTAAVTLACIVALLLGLYAIFRLFVPSVLVSLTGSLGMEAACARYSVMQYHKSESTEDLCDAVERNYYISNFAQTAVLGNELLQKEDFLSVCQSKDEQMQMPGRSVQFFTGITAVSQYRSNDGAAVSTAMSALNGNIFPRENAVVILAVSAMDREDLDLCRQLLQRLETLQPIEQDAEYFNSFLAVLQDFCK